MHRLSASGVFVWLWASSPAAAFDGAPLPDVVDEPGEPAEPPSEPEPTEPPSEAQPSEPELPSEPEPSDPFDETSPAPPDEPRSEPAEPPDAIAPSQPSPPPPTTASPPPPPARSGSTPPSPPAEASPTAGDPPAKPEPADATGADEHDEKSKKDDKKDDKKDEEDEEAKEKIKHKGFIVDLRVGVIGCTRPICKRHGAKPGLRLDALMGRNFFGIIDLGLAGGWGRMGTNVATGTDGLALYGLDPAALPPEAAALMFDQFTVDDAHFETVQSGLDLRVHVIPRGRFDPYVGVGAQYNLLRAVYDTPGGSTRLGFHGLAFPLQAGFVAFVHKNIALGAQFDYLVTWYGGITVRGAPGRFAAPIPLIKDAAAEAGVNLPGDLPHFWTLGAVVHLRLGK